MTVLGISTDDVAGCVQVPLILFLYCSGGIILFKMEIICFSIATLAAVVLLLVVSPTSIILKCI